MSREEQAKALQAELAAVGIYGMYGGSKGHGFWLMESEQPGDDVDAAIRAGKGFRVLTMDRPHGQPSGLRTIQNDGKRSGNPYFTMFSDAKQVLVARAAIAIATAIDQTKED